MQTFSQVWTTKDDLIQLQAQLPSQYASLLIQIFWGNPSFDEIPMLQAQLREVFPEAMVVGCSADGQIEGSTIRESSVFITASVFEKTHLKSLLVPSESALSNVQMVEKAFMDSEPPKLVLSYLNSNMNAEAFVEAFNLSLPGVPLTGGVASCQDHQHPTIVFDQNEVSALGVITVAFYGELFVTLDSRLSWQPVGPHFTVTKADKEIIYEIENQPALDFYADYLSEKIAYRHMPAIAEEFPLMYQKEKLWFSRTAIELLDAGAIRYTGEFHTGQKVQFGMGLHEHIAENIRELSKALVQHPIEAIFVYPCTSHKALFQGFAAQELRPFEACASTFGFYTLGELTCVEEKNFLFNQSFVFVALSESSELIDTDCIASFWLEAEAEVTEDSRELMLQAMAHLSTKLAMRLESLKDKYQHMAEHDRLTGLYNRYAGERIIQAEIERANRYHTPLSMAILDIDHFKQVNDIYGHAAGDEVLVAWAEFLRSHVRKYDSVIRWGGEEVLIIFPNTPAKVAKEVLDKLRDEFSHKVFSFGESITFSGGVAEWHDYLTEVEWFKRADKALYQAKAYGRNQIVVAIDNPLL